MSIQIYATLCYLATYHDHSAAIALPNASNGYPQLATIPKNPPSGIPAIPQPAGITPAPEPAEKEEGERQSAQPTAQITGPQPDSPDVFAKRQHEMARDLVIKEQQIEHLISILPGLNMNTAQQNERIRALESELSTVEQTRRAKREELAVLKDNVDELLGAVGRGMGSQ